MHQAALLALIRHQAALYAGADCGSITREEFLALTQSIRYTLPASDLPDADVQTQFARGQALLWARLRAAKRRWQILRCVSMPVENAYYADTMRALGVFFARYDVQFRAHEIPCALDYPLLCAVPEDLQGLSYIEAYLARMQLEVQILRRFDRAQLVRLYEAAEAEYEEAFLNLCAPALHQAAGRALLGLDARTLSLSPAEQTRLLHKIRTLPRGALQAALDGAARDVCRALGLPGAEGYVQAALRALVPRLYEAARHGSVRAVFPVAAEEK